MRRDSGGTGVDSADTGGVHVSRSLQSSDFGHRCGALLTPSPVLRDAFAMRSLALAFVLLAMAGCSTSGDNGSGLIGCGTPACGGDLVGKWRIVSFCGAGTYQTTQLYCAEEITIERAGVAVTGTAEYAADGGYTETITQSGTMHITYPASCLATMMGPTTCDDVAKLYAGTGSSYSCSDAGGCACTAQLVNDTFAEQGTYRILGTGVIKQSPSIIMMSPADYCVQGNRLVEEMMGVQYVFERVP
jgi:hypothetical protein